MALNCYCPTGHRVPFNGVKPVNCPVCGTAMNPPLPPATVPSQTAAAALRPVRGGWGDLVSENGLAGGPQAEQAFGDMTFDRGTLKTGGSARLMTFKELRESGNPVERIDSPVPREVAEGSGGSERVDTRTLVQQMVEASAHTIAAAAAAPARRAAKPRAPRASRSRAPKGGGAS